MDAGKNYIVGIFEDEDVLMKAVTNIRESGVKIQEVYSPFPVHGLDEVLGYKRTKIAVAAFVFGLVGTSLALLMQIWMMGVDWPMIIGGKDYIAIPTFIPITFEVTVLLAALGMVGTFFVISNMKPYGKPRIYDLRSTDDKHVMAIDLAKNAKKYAEIETILKNNGASEVNEKNFEN